MNFLKQLGERVKTMAVPSEVPADALVIPSAVAVMEAPAASVREPVPAPAGRPVSVDASLELDAYQDVASELGFQPTVLVEERFRAFLATKGFPVYDYAEVAAYLTDQYGPPVPREVKPTDWDQRRFSATWGWRPLRQADASRGAGINIWGFQHNGVVMIGSAPYHKAVPLPVLLTARDIVREFPDAQFFVSDEIRPQDIPLLDPFLMVTVAGKSFIVERWDEPSFRGTK
jgi:hypothetical protein